MGERYFLNLPCARCEAINEVYYAPTCDFKDFKCLNCGALNGINYSFCSYMINDKEVNSEDVKPNN